MTLRQAIARWAFPLGFGVALLAPVVAPSHARAQTRDQIRERDEQLYQQYGGSDTSGAPAETPAPSGVPAVSGTSGGGDLTAQLLDRVSSLEAQVRTLRGRVDELEQQLSSSSASLNKQIGDLSFQLQQQGQAGATAGRNPAAALADAAPPAVAPPPPPSRRGMRPTPSTTRTEPSPASTQYQLGDTYAQQHDFQQAAVAFYGAYTKAPRGPLAPVALYRVGSSMAALGQTGAACEALGKLHAEFPTLHSGVAGGAASLRHRLHC